ncbi:MAG: UDP-3-O-acyl-N-acetylglucosamine deacetylase [Candidatus Sumerlaeaceae bacterium]|nr:UDP-3-O-acyl-N-acetylglucosamine deacetylase [Candidatus Sumerlaeaceae bacterium]
MIEPLATAVRPQRTIAQSIGASGRGVHSGRLTNLRLLPAADGVGIVFRRTDMRGAPDIPATLDSVMAAELQRRTTLAVGEARVHTVEHILSAAYGLGIDNLIVELDGPEPPFLDGSAKPFVEMIESAGVCELNSPVQAVALPHPVAFSLDDADYSALPSEHLRVTFFFASDESLLRRQSASLIVTPDVFARDIAPARTFCFFREIEALQRAGLIGGGTLASAVVIGRKAILNESLRFADEPVRHKILDFIGDLALLGRPVAGHFLVARGGHRTNAAFGQFLRKELGL